MSTRAAYELEDGTLVRTQGEIPKGQPVKKIAIPIAHQELIDFINARQAQSPQTAGTPADGQPQPPAEPLDPVPVPAAAPTKLPDEGEARRKMVAMLQGMRTEEIEERIINAKGPDFARYCVAAIERFGQLGKEAWGGVRGHLELHAAQVSAYDRGLHLLALSCIERLDEEPPKAKSYAELQKVG